MDPDQQTSPDWVPPMIAAPAPDGGSSNDAPVCVAPPAPAPATGDPDNAMLSTVPPADAPPYMIARPDDTPPSSPSSGDPGTPWGDAPIPGTPLKLAGIASKFSDESPFTKGIGNTSTLLGGINDLSAAGDKLDNGDTEGGLWTGTKGAAELGAGGGGIANQLLQNPILGGGVGILGGGAGYLGGVDDANKGLQAYASTSDTDQQTTALVQTADGELTAAGGLASSVAAAAGGGLGLTAPVTAAAAGTLGGIGSIGATVAAGLALGGAAGVGLEAAGKQYSGLTEPGVVGADGKPVPESGADRVADWAQDVAQLGDPAHFDHGAYNPGGQSLAAQAAGMYTAIQLAPLAGLMDIAALASQDRVGVAGALAGPLAPLVTGAMLAAPDDGKSE